MALETALTKLLGIQAPIIGAPMGAVAGGRLAAALTRAGGLGLLGPGYFAPDWIEREFAAAGNTPVGIGFITWHLLQNPDRLEAALMRCVENGFDRRANAVAAKLTRSLGRRVREGEHELPVRYGLPRVFQPCEHLGQARVRLKVRGV